MLLRIGSGAAISAILMMLWGFMFWALFGLQGGVVSPLPKGEELGAALSEKLPGTGAYLWPGPPPADGSASEVEKYGQACRKGPLVHLFFSREGTAPMTFTTVARGFLHFLIVAILAGCLLAVAAPRLKSYPKRLGFVVLAGLFATVSLNLGQPIWWHHPWKYHLWLAAYDLFNALVMGIVLAACIKPPSGVYWTLDGR